MNKKLFRYIISACVIGGAVSALAQATDSTISPVVATPSVSPTSVMMPPVRNQPQQQMMLQVGPKGEVLLRGTLVSSSAGVITVKSWGGIWTVNIPSTAEVLPVALNKDITKSVVGDFVGVQGTMSTTASWTIDASVVRNREESAGKSGRVEQPVGIMGGNERVQKQNQKESSMQSTQVGNPGQMPQQPQRQKEDNESNQGGVSGIQLQIQQILQQISQLRNQMKGGNTTTPPPATTPTTATAPIQ